MDITAFLNRASQQVTSVLNRSGSWARRKASHIRRTRKTEENTAAGPRSEHAHRFLHIYIFIFYLI